MNSQGGDGGASGNPFGTPEQLEVAKMLREEQRANSGGRVGARGGGQLRGRRGGNTASASSFRGRGGAALSTLNHFPRGRGQATNSASGSGVDRGRAFEATYSVGPSTAQLRFKSTSPNRTRVSLSHTSPIPNNTQRPPSPVRIRDSILIEKPVARISVIPSVPPQAQSTTNFPRFVIDYRGSFGHPVGSISLDSPMDLDEPEGGLSLLDSAVPEEFQSRMTEVMTPTPTPGSMQRSVFKGTLADSMWNPANAFSRQENVRPNIQNQRNAQATSQVPAMNFQPQNPPVNINVGHAARPGAVPLPKGKGLSDSMWAPGNEPGRKRSAK